MRAALIVPHIQVQFFSPADGMSAAAKMGTSAPPSWQLCHQATSSSRARERGQCRFMADRVISLPRSNWRRFQSEADINSRRSQNRIYEYPPSLLRNPIEA
jgi:hypothetical protein